MGLFSRKRRKHPAAKNSSAPVSAPDRAMSDAEQVGDLQERITALMSRLEEQADPEERVKLLNELGGLQQEVGDTDSAISSYEASMAIREQFGPAYNGLLSLYNEQLRTAAKARDDAAIQRWTDRLDGLTALSKRVMRSQF